MLFCPVRTTLFALLAVILLAPDRARAATLYENLGGKAAVSAIAANAIALYMTDTRLRSYFDNVAPEHLRLRFEQFVCAVADGPCRYQGRSMAAAHKGLHVNEAAFNAVVEDLQMAMSRADIPFRTQNRLLARLAPMERDIVTR